MRDRLKDEAYFKNDTYHSTILKFEGLVERLIRERGADDEGVENGYDSLCGYHYNKLIAMYSAGRSLHEIRRALPPLIGLMEKIRGSDEEAVMDYDYYLEVVWLLSIGIMLEIDKTSLSRVKQLALIYEEDALVNFLLNPRDSGPKSTFLFGLPYKNLLPVISGIDPAQQVLSLKSYLENDWYKGHRQAWWYETHHDDDIIYPGYWSFDSGAIVKILDLDDNSLKDVPYYPYDMVHFKK
ncbi:hypothetical protein AV656_08535 [Bhargavaea cecembensis]|uniref:PoNi C-terminal domain-containing protein n=1 Tax=Bhargavaea cecembensis TaxID=394098 RepID=A0A163FME6_9BACL|nr:PoNe immunity protein domain-containing protein [Bhargavaea cecembensis]KZE38936.1 hypothetical protein AV656_08535 [Bhargavaea cecembensis]